MSAFYDQASLVVVPSGYKSGKIYAQKPLTTDGQLTFTRASTATRVNASGLIETVASGVPRLDYTNSTCPKLLLEPQRTNRMPRSEGFDNAVWIKLNATITADAAVSPDGTSNADQIIDDTTNGEHIAYQILSSRSVGTAWSVFMKKGTLDYGFIGNVQSSTAFTTAVIDLTNGTVKELQNGSGNTGSVTVQNYGNGWYRVIMQSSANGGGTSIGCSDGSALSGTTKNAIYTGTGKHIFIWGAQLEDAAYTTSYVKTEAAAVTRLADAASKTGISSLIGQTEGTVFFDWIMTRESASTSEDYYPIAISDGTSANMVTLNNYNNKLLAYVSSGGSAVFTNDSFSGSSGLRIKAAIAYKQNDFAFYINGVQIATDNAGAAPVGMSVINVGTYITGANNDPIQVNQVLLFKTRLTNAQLAELTTL